MYTKSIVFITLAYIHLFYCTTEDDGRMNVVKPAVDKVWEVIQSFSGIKLWVRKSGETFSIGNSGTTTRSIDNHRTGYRGWLSRTTNSECSRPGLSAGIV